MRDIILLWTLSIASTTALCGCDASSKNGAGGGADASETESSLGEEAEEESSVGDTDGTASAVVADVLSVTISGDVGAYTFAVEVSSPDTGCSQYANWWEVLSPKGELLYRRILAHSHTSEQPFVRSGGPVPIQADTEVLVRAHMDPAGYGGAVLRGSVLGGLVQDTEIDGRFATALASQKPLPTICAY